MRLPWSCLLTGIASRSVPGTERDKRPKRKIAKSFAQGHHCCQSQRSVQDHSGPCGSQIPQKISQGQPATTPTSMKAKQQVSSPRHGKAFHLFVLSSTVAGKPSSSTFSSWIGPALRQVKANLSENFQASKNFQHDFWPSLCGMKGFEFLWRTSRDIGASNAG